MKIVRRREVAGTDRVIVAFIEFDESVSREYQMPGSVHMPVLETYLKKNDFVC